LPAKVVGRSMYIYKKGNSSVCAPTEAVAKAANCFVCFTSVFKWLPIFFPCFPVLRPKINVSRPIKVQFMWTRPIEIQFLPHGLYVSDGSLQILYRPISGWHMAYSDTLTSEVFGNATVFLETKLFESRPHPTVFTHWVYTYSQAVYTYSQLDKQQPMSLLTDQQNEYKHSKQHRTCPILTSLMPNFVSRNFMCSFIARRST
jgi:hypothetical protein